MSHRYIVFVENRILKISQLLQIYVCGIQPALCLGLIEVIGRLLSA